MKDIDEMTAREMRVEIATRLGYKTYRHVTPSGRVFFAILKTPDDGEETEGFPDEGDYSWRHVSDWPNDMNAVYRDLITPLYARAYSFATYFNSPESGIATPGRRHKAYISPERGNPDFTRCDYSWWFIHDNPATAACGVWLAMMDARDKPYRKHVKDMMPDEVKAEVEERGARYEYDALAESVGGYTVVTHRAGWYVYTKEINDGRHPLILRGEGKSITEVIARLWLEIARYNER